jgi:hypothetical protein
MVHQTHTAALLVLTYGHSSVSLSINRLQASQALTAELDKQIQFANEVKSKEREDEESLAKEKKDVIEAIKLQVHFYTILYCHSYVRPYGLTHHILLVLNSKRKPKVVVAVVV